MARILVADDDAYIARVMSIWLNRYGHEVVAVRDGRKAVQSLASTSIDLIISDMNMPELDGIGFVRTVRDELRRDVPILLLTARCDQEKLEALLSGYRVRIFPKPFVPSQIASEIEELLKPVGPQVNP